VLCPFPPARFCRGDKSALAVGKRDVRDLPSSGGAPMPEMFPTGSIKATPTPLAQALLRRAIWRRFGSFPHETAASMLF